MATVTPDEALDWFRAKSINAVSNGEHIYEVGVGSGSTSVTSADTQLDVEEHRSNRDNNNVTIEETSTTGEMSVKISVSGGTEVPAGTTITEFGVWAIHPDNAPGGPNNDAADTMIHREVRAGVTLEAGDRKTFEITYIVEPR